MMTRNQLIEELRLLAKQYKDKPEAAHRIADTLLLLYIDDVEVAKIYDNVVELAGKK